MSDPVTIGNATLYQGDCLDILRTLPDASVDAVVTDPPAGINFMSKEWDHNKGGRAQWCAWMSEIASECLRVMKPGAHALVWALPRTSHWTATAWEDAGFEIRDRIAHCFGNGFPKSADVSKQIDKMAGAEREVVGKKSDFAIDQYNRDAKKHSRKRNVEIILGNHWDQDVTAPATEAAKQWQGWGTALKPAIEDWWLVRKPFKGAVAANVLEHGTGALNIDGCRVPVKDGKPVFNNGIDWSRARSSYDTGGSNRTGETSFEGRWPANLIHDGSDEVMALFPGGTGAHGRSEQPYKNSIFGSDNDFSCFVEKSTGSAARFFYCAKASKADRDEGCDALEERGRTIAFKRCANCGKQKINMPGGACKCEQPEWVDAADHAPRRNHHPTVKPTALMTYLCRLITPPGGIVLDPFMGSGSTGKAAMREGLRFIGIEREPEYFTIAKARIEAAQRQGRLDLEVAA